MIDLIVDFLADLVSDWPWTRRSRQRKRVPVIPASALRCVQRDAYNHRCVRGVGHAEQHLAASRPWTPRVGGAVATDGGCLIRAFPCCPYTDGSCSGGCR